MTRLFEAKPFIVAECGSNWQTLDHCLWSISAAKECGADAVKFQMFDWDSMYGIGFDETCHIWWTIQEEYRLPHEWLPKLKEAADALGIEFMCTAFSPELVAVVDPYVLVHKVASSDAAWPQMLEAVAKTGKPVLVSTGGKTPEEVHKAFTYLNLEGVDCYLLQCTAGYPSDYIDLGELGAGIDGISDHTLGYTATVEAARRGAVVIEKHFTAFPDLDTPDRPHSLTPKQFTRMVKLIRGEPVESEEQAMFLRHNRRLLATTDIAPGQVFKYGENYGAYRSLEDDTRGASPFDWEKVEGRMAKGEIKRGKGIGLGDVE